MKKFHMYVLPITDALINISNDVWRCARRWNLDFGPLCCGSVSPVAAWLSPFIRKTRQDYVGWKMLQIVWPPWKNIITTAHREGYLFICKCRVWSDTVLVFEFNLFMVLSPPVGRTKCESLLFHRQLTKLTYVSFICRYPYWSFVRQLRAARSI